MQIQRIAEGQPHWPALVAHLRRVDQAHWVIDSADRAGDSLLFLGAVVADEMVGNLSLREQQIVVPATPWSEGREHALHASDGAALRETFVQTFFVEQAHRGRGLGRALQEAAIAWTRERGCLQMRSWSSLDRPENHALKLSLGFALHPATHEAAAGCPVSGVYFVKRVDTGL